MQMKTLQISLAVILLGLVVWFFLIGRQAITLRRVGELRRNLISTTNELDREKYIAELIHYSNYLVKRGYLQEETFAFNRVVALNVYRSQCYNPLLRHEERRIPECPAATFMFDIDGAGTTNIFVSTVTVWDRPASIAQWKELVSALRRQIGVIQKSGQSEKHESSR